MWDIEAIKSTLQRVQQFPSRPLHNPPCPPMFLSILFGRMKPLSKMTGEIFFLTYMSQAATKPISRTIHIARTDGSDPEVINVAFSIKMAETALAIFSVTLVIMTYSVLIQRGSFMSTTAMYPQHSIERNLGSLLSLAWPKRSNEAPGRDLNLQRDSKSSSRSAGHFNSACAKLPSIRLFYLGRMDTDNHSGLVAKGWLDSAAKPNRKDSRSYRPRLWMTSGSHLTKNVVQLLVWEWVSLWLISIMVFATLLYNGFLTNELSQDSYPRLVVTLIYALAYFFHFWYVWTICMRFFTNVAAGAAWSLLERAKFAICDSKRLLHHRNGSSFKFRGIDKASSEYVPLSFDAVFKHEIDLPVALIDDAPSPPSPPPSTKDNASASDLEEDDPKEVCTALATLEKAQKIERETANESALTALDRVIANAMVMMGVTLASGFSSWTARQLTDNTPNNFAATQIGSLALLASLSLGASTMFTSAMHLAILCSSFETILSLKETKINGQAVDHYKKRQAFDTVLSFSRGTVPISHVSFFEILSTNNLHNFLSTSILGPAFTLMPSRADHERTSKETDFDLSVRVGSRIGEDVDSSRVLFTTRETDRHGRGKDGKNLEAINVCHIEDNKAGKREEKVSWIGSLAVYFIVIVAKNRESAGRQSRRYREREEGCRAGLGRKISGTKSCHYVMP